jgi:hypothetical protein
VTSDRPPDLSVEAPGITEENSVPWTILRPSTLTDGPAGGIATGDTVEREVPRATVARVIASVVTSPATTTGRIITFNDGDEDVAEVVAGG